MRASIYISVSTYLDRNFETLLRLANKYQVKSLKHESEEYLKRAALQAVKADQILTMLIAANEYHLCRPALRFLVHRLANESNESLGRLKLNRYLPAWVRYIVSCIE